MRYDKINTKENYDLLLNSGMFWEFHPELEGDWEKDKEIIMLETRVFMAARGKCGSSFNLTHEILKNERKQNS